ncbi:MAG: VWA domain-containing protein [Lachnospiraceae bacterium]
MKITVQYPVILLLIPVIIAVIIATSRSLRIGNKVRKFFITGIRIMLFSLIICAMADISVNVSSKNTGTVFLIDVSESFAANKEEAVQMVKDALAELPKGNRAAVVAFGADARVEQFMTDASMFTGVETMPVVTSTNIEKAVRAGMALFDDDEAKRIVLVTDGNQNEGQLDKMSAVLLAENVEVNVLKKDLKISNEAYISDLSVPEKIQAGDKFRVQVEVESTVKTNAILQLYTGGRLSKQENVVLQEGSNSFIFQDTRKKEGFAEYKAVIIPDKDTISLNNEYQAFTEAGGAEKVLLIEGVRNEAKEFKKLLYSSNVIYDVVNPGSAPAKLEAMNKYKCIIMENTSADSLPEGFKNSISSYVKDYGGGFITIGGKRSFALGGYKNTPIEDVLPVNMDISQDKKIPEMAMVMVIDKSGSMTMDDSGNSKLEMAKDAAASAIDNLRDTDSAGVLSFDDMYGWNVKIQKVKDKEDIKGGIYGIKEGGGTNIYPAVREAFDKIKDVDCQIKHIILLTDGQDGFYNGYPSLIEKLEKNNITLSTVSIGTDADDRFLERLAETSGGRFYNTKAGTELSRIFAQEVYLAQKEYIVNRVFTPIIKTTSSILSEEAQEGLPAMAGYIATSIKPEAQQVLSSDKDNDPVLACWQYGLGRTVAFTSDITNQWTGNYASWSGYPGFWKNIINWVTDIAEEEGSTISVSQEGSKGRIVYTTKDYSGKTKIKAICTGEDGKKEEIELKATSPGVFEGETEAADTGIYSINVKNTEDDVIKDSKNTRLAMQYSQEYRFEDVTDCLDSFTSQSSGKFIDNLDGIFDSMPEKVQANKNITVPLLVASVIFLLIDIVYRRLDLKLGAKLAIAVQGKAAAIYQAAREEAVKTAKTSSKTARSQAQSTENNNAGLKENTQDMLDIGSLLAKQKERER